MIKSGIDTAAASMSVTLDSKSRRRSHPATKIALTMGTRQNNAKGKENK